MSAEVLALPHTYLVFRLGGRSFGFEARFLWEAAATVSFTDVPQRGGILVGVTQLHGKIIPVLDLAELLGAPLSAEPGGFVTVHLPGPPELLAGFLVEAVVGFVKSQPEQIHFTGEARDGSPYERGRIGAEKEICLLEIEKVVLDQALGKPQG